MPDFPDWLQRKRSRNYVRRDTVVDYLEDYARTLNVAIAFDTRVQAVTRNGNRWHVATDKGDYDCAHVIVATGRESLPSIPIWPGMDRFGRKLIHTADFGEASQY